MKLVKRKENGIYYVRDGNKRWSLKTTDRAIAIRKFNAIKTGRLQDLINQATSGMTISEFEKEYLSCRQDKSDMTLAVDERAIDKLLACLGDIPLKTLRIQDIERFKQFEKLQNKDIKNTSINAYLRHIRTFLNKAYDLGYIENKIKVTLLKTPKALPRFLSETERTIILSYAKNNLPYMYDIIIFALYTGCRVSEIANADYGHIVDGDLLKVTGKGEKQRLIPLLPDIGKTLKNPLPASGRIFPYSAEHISKSFKKITRACGIEDLHFHHLRHTAATFMIANGIDILYAKELLGHTKIETTLIYSHIVKDVLKTQMKKLKY